MEVWAVELRDDQEGWMKVWLDFAKRAAGSAVGPRSCRVLGEKTKHLKRVKKFVRREGERVLKGAFCWFFDVYIPCFEQRT